MENYNKEELEDLIINQKYSYLEIGRMYGVSGTAIKKHAKKLGIKLPRRRVINPKENFSHKGKRNIKKSYISSKVNDTSDEDFIKVILKCSTWKDISVQFGYKGGVSSNIKKTIEDRCLKLNISLSPNLIETTDISNITKGELFRNSKNWQAARSAIQKNARKVYFENIDKCECAVCGYSNHIEVAHIKSVSSFDNNALIGQINSIDNLIGLCPNHHWEYDHGILEILPNGRI